MSEEMSIESLYAAGTGITNNSTEAFKIDNTDRMDNDIDNAFKEVKSAEALLDFVSTYDKLDIKNTSDKLKMLKRIDANYGKCNRGIESYCYERSLEADAAKAEDVASKTGDPKAKDIADNMSKKKGNFMKTIFSAIGNFFKSIWKFITGLVTKFTGWVKGLAAKHAANKELKKEDKNDNSPAAGAPSKALETNRTISLDFRKPLNGSKFDKYVIDFTKFATNVESIYKEKDRLISSAKSASDGTGAVNKFALNAVAPLIDSSRKLYQIPGFTGNTNGQQSSTKNDLNSVKKTLSGIEKNVKFDGKDGDATYKVIDYMLGLKKSFGGQYNKEDRKTLIANYDKLAKIVSSGVSKMKGPHDQLVRRSDQAIKDFNAAVEGHEKSELNKSTYAMRESLFGILAASMKIACKVEQSIGTIINKSFQAATATNAKMK